MNHRRLSGLAAALLLVPSGPAQVSPHERCLLKPLTGAFGPSGGTWQPLRQGRKVVQVWLRANNIRGGHRILSSASRLGSQNTSQAATYQIEIVFDNTALAFNRLSPNPASNLSNSATKVFQGNLNVPLAARSTDPNNVHVWVKHTRPWIFRGPNLIVQRTWTPGAKQGTRYYNGINMINLTSAHVSAGKTCGGTLTAAHSGTTYALTVTAAPPNTAGVFLLSNENVQLGPTPFPIDLTAAGLTGCQLGLVPIVLAPLSVNRSGTATLSVPFPLPTNAIVLSAQAVHRTTANPAGWATTNVVNSILGTAGLVNRVTVVNARTFGPFKYNTSGALLLVR